MEKYVVSRELAEKLKRAGYPQDKSILTWRQQQWSKLIWAVDARMFINIPQIAAPIADELLEQLPGYIYQETRGGRISGSGEQIRLDLTITNNEPEWAVDYVHRNGSFMADINNESLPNALAQLWLWLKENGYITN